MNDLDKLIRKCPKVMRASLRAQKPDFAREMAQRYLDADEAGKADITAFFESDGPRKVHESRLKIDDGIPTSHDLDKQLGAS